MLKLRNHEDGKDRNERLPETISTPIEKITKEILMLFDREKRLRPNVVIVLERSAVLPSLKATKEIKKRYPETVIVHLPIGKVIPNMFAEYKMQIDDDFDEPDLDLSNQDQKKDFLKWLSNCDDPTIKKLLRELKRLRLSNKNILIIDDSIASGETVKHNLPLLLKSQYPRKEIKFDVKSFFPGGFSWEKEIINGLNEQLTPAEIKLLSSIMKGNFDIRKFKIELESGFYEDFNIPSKELKQIRDLVDTNYKSGNAIILLNSEISIIMAGYQALFNVNAIVKTDEKNNPARRLLNHYGLERLIKFQETIKTKFENI